MLLKIVDSSIHPEVHLHTSALDENGRLTEVTQAVPSGADVAIVKQYLIDCENAKKARWISVLDLAGDKNATLHIPATDAERAGKSVSQELSVVAYVPANQTDEPWEGDVERVPDGRGAEADVKQAITNINNLIV